MHTVRREVFALPGQPVAIPGNDTVRPEVGAPEQDGLDGRALAQTAELSSDIDVKRAEEAKARAEKILYSKSADIDFQRAELALIRAIARLDAAKHRQARQ